MDFHSPVFLIKTAVFIVAVLFIYVNKKLAIYLLKRFLEVLLAPTGALRRTSKINLQRFKALILQRSHSDFILYRAYRRKQGERYGVYTLANYRKAFIIEVSPGPYLGMELENTLKNLMGNIHYDNVSIHFTTYASENIKDYMDWFDKEHNRMEKLNIDGKRAIRKLNEKKKQYFERWTKESMLSNDVDYRVRNLVNLISVTVKKDMKKSHMDALYTDITGAITNLHPREFDGRKMIIMGQELFNSDKKKYGVDDTDSIPMNKLMTRGSTVSLQREENLGKAKLTIDDLFDTNGTYRIGRNYVKTFTTESFPRNTTLSEVQNAIFDSFGKTVHMTIPCRFIATLTVSFDGVVEDTKKQLSKARWNIGQLAYIPSVVEEKNQLIKDRRNEFRACANAIDLHREKVTRGNFSISIMDPSLSVVEKSSSLLRSRFEDLPSGSWVLKEESIPVVGFLQYLYSFPAQYSPTFKKKFHRFSILYNINNSKIIPLYSDFKGFGSPVMLFTGRTGQVQYFSIYGRHTPSYSFVLIGPTGKGKSVWVNELITSSLDCGYVVRSIDLGDSQKRVNQIAGGQYESFDENNSKCLNFFTHIKTTNEVTENGVEYEQIHPDELETIVPMIGRMCGIRVNASHVNDKSINDALLNKHATIFIEQALTMAFTSRQRNAGMQEVYESLLSIKLVFERSNNHEQANFAFNLALALEDYVQIKEDGGRIRVGKYYRYFNGANNLDLKKDYFLLELLGLTKKSPEFSSVVVMAVLHKFAEEAFDRQDVFKQYIVDEAKEPLTDPLFSHFLDNFALRIRKYKGGIGVITQNIDHFFVNEEAKGVFKNAIFKIFLEQTASEVETIALSGKITLDKFSEKLMQSVKNREEEYSECMIMQGDRFMISRLKLNPFAKWLFTTQPDEKKSIKDTSRNLRISEIEAAIYHANIDAYPMMTHEENLESIIKEREVAF